MITWLVWTTWTRMSILSQKAVKLYIITHSLINSWKVCTQSATQVATDALVLKHQASSIYNADEILIVLTKFIAKCYIHHWKT